MVRRKQVIGVGRSAGIHSQSTRGRSKGFGAAGQRPQSIQLYCSTSDSWTISGQAWYMSSLFRDFPLDSSSAPSWLGLAGQHQYQNAALAVHLAQEFLRQKGELLSSEELPEVFVEGLKRARWPGRCQTVIDPEHKNTTWFLDGAHTKDSLECCMQWFISPGIGLKDDT